MGPRHIRQGDVGHIKVGTLLPAVQEVRPLRDAAAMVKQTVRLLQHRHERLPDVTGRPVGRAVRRRHVVQNLGVIREVRVEEQARADRRRPARDEQAVLRVQEIARGLG